MKHSDPSRHMVTSWDYITDSFQPDDRLAVVIKNQQKNHLTQRIATAENLASPKYQAWLRYENAQRGDIYLSMNPLKPDARGRTKNDIAAVRHLYLDLDRYALQSLMAICEDTRVPNPSYVLNTSDGKYQVIWRMTDGSPDRAEKLQRAMAIEYGADRAATDVTRVLRIPGFRNQKYSPPYQVTAEKISAVPCSIKDFKIPYEAEIHPIAKAVERRLKRHPGSGHASQSEGDWAETLRRLERGDHPSIVQTWLAQSRPDKHNPNYYAALTVRKALAEIERRREGPSLDF
jgi:hypothetical protein